MKVFQVHLVVSQCDSGGTRYTYGVGTVGIGGIDLRVIRACEIPGWSGVAVATWVIFKVKNEQQQNKSFETSFETSIDSFVFHIIQQLRNVGYYAQKLGQL